MKNDSPPPPPQPGPDDQVIGFTEEERAAMDATVNRGHANPREVIDAFSQEALSVAGIGLRPLTLGMFLFLESIDHPILQEGPGGTPPQMGSFDIAVAVYVMSAPLAEVRQAHTAGADTWQQAIYDFAERIPASALPGLGEAIAALLSAAFATALGGEKKTDPTLATASDGDSPSSTRCSASTVAASRPRL